MVNEPELERPDPRHARPPEQTWRILFLDTAENVEHLKETGKDAGYVVVGATSIEEAWAFLEGKDHVDVIACAAHLPEESMFDFLQGVRRSERHGKVMFLILSLEPGLAGARLDRSAAKAGMALGADAYSIMPVFDPVELIAQLRTLQPEVPTLQRATPEERRLAE